MFQYRAQQQVGERALSAFIVHQLIEAKRVVERIRLADAALDLPGGGTNDVHGLHARVQISLVLERFHRRPQSFERSRRISSRLDLHSQHGQIVLVPQRNVGLAGKDDVISLLQADYLDVRDTIEQLRVSRAS